MCTRFRSTSKSMHIPHRILTIESRPVMIPTGKRLFSFMLHDEGLHFAIHNNIAVDSELYFFRILVRKVLWVFQGCYPVLPC